MPHLHRSLLCAATLLALTCASACDDARDPLQSPTDTGANNDTDPAADQSDLLDLPGPDTRDTQPDLTADLDAEEVDTFIPPAPVQRLSAAPYTTLQMTWAPAPLPDETRRLISSGELLLPHIAAYEQVGIRVVRGPGEPWQEHLELAPGYDPQVPPAGPPRSLLYLWQVADSQLIDEESPIRFEGVYLAPVGSAYKPHGHLTTQVFESHVRTARRISDHSGRPFDLALVTGDLVDGGQVNELMWFATIMGGGVVDPDSGQDDDPMPGAGNDFNDPFYSAGIGVPWYAAIGNHEVLYSGFWEADDEVQAAAVGDRVVDFVERFLGFVSGPGLRNGFRDGRTLWGDVVDQGETVADPLRRIASLRETMQLLYEAPGEPLGHGFTTEAIDAGRGWFSFHPLPGKPLRIICLNTLSEDPASPEGALGQAQFDWMMAELQDAEDAGELVIVASHHRSGSLQHSSPVSATTLASTLAAHDHVILHLTGHGHYSRKELFPSPRPGGLGHWELMAPAVVDFPQQSRIVEVVYEGEGYLAVYVTNLEQNAAEGTMAHEARHYAVGRQHWFTTDYASAYAAERTERNLLLRYRLPARFATSIEAHDWPTRVESLETLARFEAP